MRLISISVISHLQGDLVAELLADLESHCACEPLEVILTLNLPEKLPVAEHDYPFPLKVIHNRLPQGFGENHNQAFQQSTGQFFCVINPDIRLNENPFPVLFSRLQDTSIGVAAPLVVDENGTMEDSARRFPTPLKILCKALGRCKGRDYNATNEVFFPDWVGGMFMFFRRKTFEQIGGFDQRYFLYYEDVDLCARVRLLDYEVAMCPNAKAVHHAQRSSHRSIKYMQWHLVSMVRFFLSLPFLKTYWRHLTKKSP